MKRGLKDRPKKGSKPPKAATGRKKSYACRRSLYIVDYKIYKIYKTYKIYNSNNSNNSNNSDKLPAPITGGRSASSRL